MKKLRVVGIDMATQGFHLGGMAEPGTLWVRKRLYRAQVMGFIAPLPPPLIGLEACGGAHAWARRFREHGHEVKRRAPQGVNPSGTAHQNDRRDAAAIADAVPRPTRRCVPTKDGGQPALHALPRVRARLMGERPALVHAGHGLLPESGLGRPTGGAKCRQAVGEQLAAEQEKLPPLSQALCGTLGEECAALDKQRAADQEQLAALATTPPAWQRLRTLPGLGPCRATALVAAVREARACKHGRQCAAWLGLVPRPHSTGGKERVVGISTRGDS